MRCDPLASAVRPTSTSNGRFIWMDNTPGADAAWAVGDNNGQLETGESSQPASLRLVFPLDPVQATPIEGKEGLWAPMGEFLVRLVTLLWTKESQWMAKLDGQPPVRPGPGDILIERDFVLKIDERAPIQLTVP
ncbi:MAG: hypothetical protein KDN04_14655 [Verrucomicrobiae bacterium]|nr:hypothetical protein [Verrucomicrobiae bacterium]